MHGRFTSAQDEAIHVAISLVLKVGYLKEISFSNKDKGNHF